MKRLFILFTIYFASHSVFGQSIDPPQVMHCTLNPVNFSTTVFASPVYSWYEFDKNRYTSSRSNTGYSIGAREEYRSNQYLSFGIEGEVVHTSYNFFSRYDAVGFNEGVEDAFKHMVSTTILDVPVYMKLHIPHTERLSYYVAGGIGLSYMFDGSSEVQQVLPTENEPAMAGKKPLNMPAAGFFMPGSGYYTFALGSEIKLKNKTSLLLELKSRSEMDYRQYHYIIDQAGATPSIFGIREHSLSLVAGLKF